MNQKWQQCPSFSECMLIWFNLLSPHCKDSAQQVTVTSCVTQCLASTCADIVSTHSTCAHCQHTQCLCAIQNPLALVLTLTSLVSNHTTGLLPKYLSSSLIAELLILLLQLLYKLILALQSLLHLCSQLLLLHSLQLIPQLCLRRAGLQARRYVKQKRTNCYITVKPNLSTLSGCESNKTMVALDTV